MAHYQFAMAESAREVISPALLERINEDKPVPRAFSLGMDDWLDETVFKNEAEVASSNSEPNLPSECHANEPRPKRFKPSTTVQEKLTEKGNAARFQLFTEDELDSLSVCFVPQNTTRSTKWALSTFEKWLNNRNCCSKAGERCPQDLLHSKDPSLLSKWLAAFVAEARKQNGDPYPPKTLYALLTGLWRHMKELDETAPNILNTGDPQFKKLHHTIDTVFRRLRVSGVGASRKSAEPFTKEDENKLWSSGVMTVSNPRGLLRAVFYYNGKNFCLRGGEEHRGLRPSQLKRTETGYTYTENASKNRAGGLAQLRLLNKVVHIAADDEATDRCHCRLLDLYISKLPEKAKSQDLFYVRPSDNATSQEWFTSVPIGRNSLAKMIPEMCKEAGIEGHKTNHSLRATGATELYNAGVPEKIIQERTGHRSVECLRTYEQTSGKQLQAVSKVLSSSAPTTFQQQMESLNGTPSGPVQERTPTNFKSPQSSTSTVVPNLSFSGCSVNINFGQMTFQSPLISHQHSENSVHATQELELPTMEEMTAFLQDIESDTA